MADFMHVAQLNSWVNRYLVKNGEIDEDGIKMYGSQIGLSIHDLNPQIRTVADLNKLAFKCQCKKHGAEESFACSTENISQLLAKGIKSSIQFEKAQGKYGAELNRGTTNAIAANKNGPPSANGPNNTQGTAGSNRLWMVA